MSFFDFGRRFTDVSEMGRLQGCPLRRRFFDFGGLFADKIENRDFGCFGGVRVWCLVFVHLAAVLEAKSKRAICAGGLFVRLK